MDIITIIIDELESIIGQPTSTTLVDGTFFIFFDEKLIAQVNIKDEQDGKRVFGDVAEDFTARYNVSWPELCGRLFRAIKKELPEDKYSVDHDPYSYKIDYYIKNKIEGVYYG